MARTLELLDKLTTVVFEQEVAGHVPHHLLVQIKDHMKAMLPLSDPRHETLLQAAAEQYEEEGSVHIEPNGKIVMIDGEEKGAWVQAYVWVSLEDGQ
jgi:hypothetical protein